MKRKEIKKEFFSTDEGTLLNARLRRILIYSIILLVFGVYFLIDAYIKKDSIAKYIYGSILIFFAIIFMIGRIFILRSQLQNYIINSKDSKKKKK